MFWSLPAEPPELSARGTPDLTSESRGSIFAPDIFASLPALEMLLVQDISYVNSLFWSSQRDRLRIPCPRFVRMSGGPTRTSLSCCSCGRYIRNVFSRMLIFIREIGKSKSYASEMTVGALKLKYSSTMNVDPCRTDEKLCAGLRNKD